MQSKKFALILCFMVFLFGSARYSLPYSKVLTNSNPSEIYAEMLSSLLSSKGQAHAIAYGIKSMPHDNITMGPDHFRKRMDQCRDIYTQAKIIQDQIIGNIIAQLRLGIFPVEKSQGRTPDISKEFKELDKCREDINNRYRQTPVASFHELKKLAKASPLLDTIQNGLIVINLYYAQPSPSKPPEGFLEEIKKTYWLPIVSPIEEFERGTFL